MTSTAQKSQGATIAVGNGASPEVFTTIANITGIGGPNLEAPDIDVSDLSSTFREYLLGLPDAGTLELSGFYSQANTQHQTLRDAVQAGTAYNFKITLTEGSPLETVTVSARVMAWSMNIAVDEAVSMEMSLKISGAPTFSN